MAVPLARDTLDCGTVGNYRKGTSLARKFWSKTLRNYKVVPDTMNSKTPATLRGKTRASRSEVNQVGS